MVNKFHRATMTAFMQQLHNYIYKHSVNTGYLYMYLFPEADIYIQRKVETDIRKRKLSTYRNN